jgi:hypothetical protein
MYYSEEIPAVDLDTATLKILVSSAQNDGQKIKRNKVENYNFGFQRMLL